MKLLSLSPMPFAMMLKKFHVENPIQKQIEIIEAHGIPDADLLNLANGASAVLADYSGNHHITADLVKDLHSVKFIQTISVGYQHIDVDSCSRKNIIVANTEGANAASVAEHTIMAGLSLLKDSALAHRSTYDGKWLQMTIQANDLLGKRWGIIGMGNSGKAVAKRLIPFETDTFYFSRSRLTAADEDKYKASFLQLHELLSTSDIISLHCPLTPETENLLAAEELNLLKPGAIVINVARGGIINETALANSLKNRHIRGAAIDVFSREPISADNSLLTINSDQLLLSPHNSGATIEAKQRILAMALDNLNRFFNGDMPRHIVNPTCCQKAQ